MSWGTYVLTRGFLVRFLPTAHGFPGECVFTWVLAHASHKQTLAQEGVGAEVKSLSWGETEAGQVLMEPGCCLVTMMTGSLC